MLKVGLTGSIAVGKTFVCREFEKLGCQVIDADLTAREVVRKGTHGLEQIVASFGGSILTDGGELDRKELGRIVFADEAKRMLLNSIVHPLVIAEQDKVIAEIERDGKTEIVIVDAALMIESGGYKRFDKLIVVWCQPQIQIERLMERDDIDRETALSRISAQMPQAEKKRYADLLIDTSNGFEETRTQVAEIYRQLAFVDN